jgi:hypothetical protein
MVHVMENEVCEQCGTPVTYRKVDVTSMADVTRQYTNVADRCPNRNCLNNDPRNHTFNWAVSAEEYSAEHPAG